MNNDLSVGIVVFPGSNCDHDTIAAISSLGAKPVVLDYRLHSLPVLDRVILPGGFSYGDYLRSGALAAAAPIMDAVEQAAADGLPVLGICNGFQILCERGLLPGTLLPNPSGEFICQWQAVRVASESPLFTGLDQGRVLRLPIAHHEGSYRVAQGQLAELFERGQIFLQYSDAEGQLHGLTNPNGSVANIAGVQNRNVVGLMPHPERAMAAYLGSRDGWDLLASWLGMGENAVC